MTDYDERGFAADRRVVYNALYIADGVDSLIDALFTTVKSRLAVPSALQVV
jgi:hypothetical protein